MDMRPLSQLRPDPDEEKRRKADQKRQVVQEDPWTVQPKTRSRLKAGQFTLGKLLLVMSVLAVAAALGRFLWVSATDEGQEHNRILSIALVLVAPMVLLFLASGYHTFARWRRDRRR